MRMCLGGGPDWEGGRERQELPDAELRLTDLLNSFLILKVVIKDSLLLAKHIHHQGNLEGVQ